MLFINPKQIYRIQNTSNYCKICYNKIVTNSQISYLSGSKGSSFYEKQVQIIENLDAKHQKRESMKPTIGNKEGTL